MKTLKKLIIGKDKRESARSQPGGESESAPVTLTRKPSPTSEAKEKPEPAQTSVESESKSTPTKSTVDKSIATTSPTESKKSLERPPELLTKRSPRQSSPSDSVDRPAEITAEHMWGRGTKVLPLPVAKQKERQSLLETLAASIAKKLNADITNSTTVFGTMPLKMNIDGVLELGELEWDKDLGLSGPTPDGLKSQVADILSQSGQLQILQQHAKEGAFNFDLSLDYFHLRSLAAVAFHKDTLGQTLFINLAFGNKDPILGPEAVIDLGPPENDLTAASALRDYEKNLPKWFQDDLLQARQTWRAKLALDKQSATSDAFKIWGEVVQPFGTVSFNDALVIHTTPDVRSRSATYTGSAYKPIATHTTFDVAGKKDLAIPGPPLANRSRSYSQGSVFTSKIPVTTLNTPRSFIRLEVRANPIAKSAQ